MYSLRVIVTVQAITMLRRYLELDGSLANFYCNVSIALWLSSSGKTCAIPVLPDEESQRAIAIKFCQTTVSSEYPRSILYHVLTRTVPLRID